MPKLPESMLIAPFPVTVRMMDPVLAASSGQNGHFDETALQIGLAADLSAARMLEVVLHETVHGFIGLARVPVPQASEEPVVEQLGLALARWWIDNPDWVKAIESLATAERKRRAE